MICYSLEDLKSRWCGAQSASYDRLDPVDERLGLRRRDDGLCDRDLIFYTCGQPACHGSRGGIWSQGECLLEAPAKQQTALDGTLTQSFLVPLWLFDT